MENANIQIRLAEEKDCSAMLAIYAPYITGSTASFEYEVPNEAEFWQRIQKIVVKTPWIVCEWDGQIAGYAYAGPHRSREAYSWSTELSVYVHPDFRKRNIATALYKTCVAILKLQGYCNILAGIALPNPGSEAFHRHFGFKSVGIYEKVGYKFGAWRNTHWMQLFIGDETQKPRPLIALEAIKSQIEFKQILSQSVALIEKK